MFTNDVKRCNYYKEESQNVKKKGYCKYPDNFLQFKEAQGKVVILIDKRRCMILGSSHVKIEISW